MSSELFSDPEEMQESWCNTSATSKPDLLRSTPDQRVAAARRIRVLHPAYQSALIFVERTFDKFGRFEDPGGGRIIAKSGGGKTSIVQHMLEKHPAQDTPERLIMPVMAIKTPPGARMGTFLDLMLSRCSFHLATSKIRNYQDLPNHGKIENVIDALKRCQVRLILVDEFGHIGERKQGSQSKEITDTFKTIYNDTNIGQIFFGEENANLPFEQNEQFRTRLPGKIDLHLFEYDAEFLGVLNCFDEELPMRFQAGLAGPELSYPLFLASGGQMRSLVKLLAEAVFYAAIEKKEKIASIHLHSAYDSIFGDDPRRPNPFGSIRK